MKGKLLLALSLMLVTLAIAIGLTQAEGLAPHDSILSTTLVGSAFTYQGQLKSNGNPVNGICDFRFSLWDSLGDVTGQIGITQTRTGIAVTSGLFTINDLDFGTSAFNGDARWLQIDVRCPTGVGNYAALTPRQSITAVPYSQYSRAAVTATLALSSTQAPWSGLTGMPAGFADSIDNGAVYTRTVIVSPIGTATQNGTALLNALANITAASTNNPYLLKIEPGVYDLITSTLFMKPYVDVEGSGESVTTITSAGNPPPTTITGTVIGADNAELRFVTVKMSGGYKPIALYNQSASPKITHVTAMAIGDFSSTDSAYGIYDKNSSPLMTNVTISATGGTNANYGLYNDNSSPSMMNFSADVSGGSFCYGVYNLSSAPTMRSVFVTAISCGPHTIGMYNDTSSPIMNQVVVIATRGIENIAVDNSNSSPTMTDVTATAWCQSATAHYYCTGVLNSNSSPLMTNVTAAALNGGRKNYGISNSGGAPIMNSVVITAYGAAGPVGNCGVCNFGASPTMNHVTVNVSDGVNLNYAVYNDSSSVAIQNSTIGCASSSSTSVYGIYNTAASGAYTVTINNSQIASRINTIYNDSHFATFVGASQLSGGAVITNTGTVLCAGVYDENYTFYSNTCP